MTALLADQVITSPVLPLRVGRGPVPGLALVPPAEAWSHRQATAPAPAAGEVRVLLAPPPVAVSPAAVGAPARYEWTNRGLAVLLAVVILVVGFMATTLVTAFLAVSNAPIPAQPAAPAQVVQAQVVQAQVVRA